MIMPCWPELISKRGKPLAKTYIADRPRYHVRYSTESVTGTNVFSHFEQVTVREAYAADIPWASDGALS